MARDGARAVSNDVIEQNYSFAPEPDLTIFFDIPPEIGYQRIISGRPSLKWYEAGLDMGWTHDPFESYKILQGKIKSIYDGLVSEGRIERIDANGSVAEIQARVRLLISDKLDFANIDTIDETDRMAENIRSSSFDWMQFHEDGE